MREAVLLFSFWRREIEAQKRNNWPKITQLMNEMRRMILGSLSAFKVRSLCSSIPSSTHGPDHTIHSIFHKQFSCLCYSCSKPCKPVDNLDRALKMSSWASLTWLKSPFKWSDTRQCPRPLDLTHLSSFILLLLLPIKFIYFCILTPSTGSEAQKTEHVVQFVCLLFPWSPSQSKWQETFVNKKWIK